MRCSCLNSANLSSAPLLTPPPSLQHSLHIPYPPAFAALCNISYYVRFAFHLPLLVSNLRHALPISRALSHSGFHCFSLPLPLSLGHSLPFSVSLSIACWHYISLSPSLAWPVRVMAPGLRVTISGPSVDTFPALPPLTLPPLFTPHSLSLATCFVIFIGSEVPLSILALICKWRT